MAEAACCSGAKSSTFPPGRVVCLTRETVETRLYLLDEQDRIVGISGYVVRPPQARREKRLHLRRQPNSLPTKGPVSSLDDIHKDRCPLERLRIPDLSRVETWRRASLPPWSRAMKP
jgi:hypothetical protein